MAHGVSDFIQAVHRFKIVEVVAGFAQDFFHEGDTERLLQIRADDGPMVANKVGAIRGIGSIFVLHGFNFQRHIVETSHESSIPGGPIETEGESDRIFLCQPLAEHFRNDSRIGDVDAVGKIRQMIFNAGQFKEMGN